MNAETDEPDQRVYVVSNARTPTSIFHVREDCSQLVKATRHREVSRAAVPHHEPCTNCAAEPDLDAGTVAIAKGSTNTIYHVREDCPRLAPADDVAVVERETVPAHRPCGACSDGGDRQ